MSQPAQRARAWLDVAIGGRPAQRITFELYSDVLPRTCENFRALCAGDRGARLTYAGSTFHRVIRNFMIQGGDFTRGDGTGGESVYGEKFADEGFPHKHDAAHVLSMANAGPDTNGSQFFVTLRATPHLDGKHVVFGRVAAGGDVVDAIARVAVDASDAPVAAVRIVACGAAAAGAAAAEPGPAAEAVAEPEPEPEAATDPRDESDESDEPGADASDAAKRLKALRRKMRAGRRDNAQAATVERRRLREDGDGAKARRRERDARDEARKAELAKRGVPAERAYVLDSAETAGRRDDAKKKKERRRAAFGWDVFNDDSKHKAYEKRVASLPAGGADDDAREAEDPLAYGGARVDDPRAVRRMAKELEGRAQQRSKFSRRRPEVPGADVDAINDRNAHFNKKLKRAFDKYTVEIRQDLERGTAI